MDIDRFNRLARALAVKPTRRGISRALAGLSLGGVLISPQDDTAEAKKKKKSCRPCQKRKRGKCKGPKPDGAACNGNGKCFAGACQPRPICLRVGTECVEETADNCCSGVCVGNSSCQASAETNQCVETADCLTGQGLECVAYVCRRP